MVFYNNLKDIRHIFLIFKEQGNEYVDQFVIFHIGQFVERELKLSKIFQQSALNENIF